MKAQRSARRPAYVIVFAIIAMIVIVTLSFALAHLAALGITRERQATLESRAQQAVESARAWSAVRAGELTGAATVVLPINELLPPDAHGQVELRRVVSADGAELVECRLTIRRARQSLRRRVYWPPPAVSTTRPAGDPARP